jgi:Bacterial archaeo-eukaryotic release factor family 3
MLMMVENVMWEKAVSTRELKMICGSEWPCISILQPVQALTSRSTQKPVRLKKAIQSVEQILTARNVDPAAQRDLLEPLYELEEQEAGEERQGKGFVLFRSRRVFRHFYVSAHLDEFVTVADHFYILPLLPLAGSGKIFYILSLSQKHIRLTRCSGGASVEVALPQSVPRTLEDAMQTARPDHVLDNRAWGGPSMGSMKGVMFGTSADREAKDEYLMHFYKEVDKGLNELLKNEESAVVLAGVDYELALYHRVSSYPHLAPGGVRGAPDSFKGEELLRRAQEVAERNFAAPLEDALQAYDKLGPERRADEWKEVVKAAYQGRIAHLFLTEGAKRFGVFDKASQAVEQHDELLPGDEDLVNAAAVETLLHGGLVDIVPPERAPEGAPISALLRY